MPVVKNPAALIALGMLVLGVLALILAVWILVVIRLVERKPLLPREPRRIVPWGAGTILAILVVYIGVQFAVIFAYRLSPAGRELADNARPKGEPAEMSSQERMFLGVAIMGSMVFLVPPVLRMTSGAHLSDLGLATRKLPQSVALGIMVCVFLLPIVFATQFAAIQIWKPKAHLIQQALTNDQTLPVAVLAVVMAVVGAPLVEEVLFRGILLGWLWKSLALRWKPVDPEIEFLEDWRDPLATLEPVPLVGEPHWSGRMDLAANVVVSLIFAGLHFEQWPAPLPLFLLSLGLGEIYRRTGSLFAPIALHASFNGLNTAMMLLAASAGVVPPN